MEIKLKSYQYDFLYSQKRFPALVGGWGTGKTLLAISRSLIYSKLIPNNLGIIFRKTYRSLADSTMKDFERYTGIKIPSNRTVTFPNKSAIMFRHIDELTSINQQNINLGWFYIEQGEELESDKEFFMLFGRLRRQVKPTNAFKEMGLEPLSGWVIANAGDNWIKKLWKDTTLQGGELIEATTYDNAENLPKSFLENLEVVKERRPDIYKQYVLNDWDVSADDKVFIKKEWLKTLERVFTPSSETKRIITCDPSLGGDECVIYVLENSDIKERVILHERNTMIIAGEILALSKRHSIKDIIVDAIGIGKGIADRLNEWDLKVQEFWSSERGSRSYLNLRAEAWDYLSKLVIQQKIGKITEEELKEQLTTVRYEVIDSSGKIKAESKKEIKKRIGKSPDRADAFVMGIWGEQFIDSIQEPTRDYNFDNVAVSQGAGW